MKVQWSNLERKIVHNRLDTTRCRLNQTTGERSQLTIPPGQKSQADFLPEAGKAQDESLDDHDCGQGLDQREAVASRYVKLWYNGSALRSASPLSALGILNRTR